MQGALCVNSLASSINATVATCTTFWPQSRRKPTRRWLIAIAFWLAGGFIKSGLGNRIAYAIVSLFGKTTLGLTYSLVLSEGLLSPAIPSVAARAGGIFFPLAKALCLACGSDPEKGTEDQMGSYVMKVRSIDRALQSRWLSTNTECNGRWFRHCNEAHEASTAAGPCRCQEHPLLCRHASRQPRCRLQCSSRPWQPIPWQLTWPQMPWAPPFPGARGHSQPSCLACSRCSPCRCCSTCCTPPS
jgi:hypothetical protein